MPFINTHVSVPVPEEKRTELKARMGQAISLLPGKSEQWLMLSFEENCAMYFQGTDDPCAMLQVSVYGKTSPRDTDRLTGALTEIVSQVLSIPPERIYISYSEIRDWGWQGANF